MGVQICALLDTTVWVTRTYLSLLVRILLVYSFSSRTLSQSCLSKLFPEDFCHSPIWMATEHLHTLHWTRFNEFRLSNVSPKCHSDFLRRRKCCRLSIWRSVRQYFFTRGCWWLQSRWQSWSVHFWAFISFSTIFLPILVFLFILFNYEQFLLFEWTAPPYS